MTDNNKTSVIDIDLVANAIKRDVHHGHMLGMLIPAYNYVCPTKRLYNLYGDKQELKAAIDAGVTACDIYLLVKEYEDSSDNKTTSYFTVGTNGDEISLKSTKRVIENIEAVSKDIVIAAIKNPFAFKELYIKYIAPEIKFVEK